MQYDSSFGSGAKGRFVRIANIKQIVCGEEGAELHVSLGLQGWALPKAKSSRMPPFLTLMAKSEVPTKNQSEHFRTKIQWRHTKNGFP
jgi:hypothetical protein